MNLHQSRFLLEQVERRNSPRRGGLRGHLGAGGHEEAWCHAAMGGSSQGHEEADKRLSLAMLPLFPSMSPSCILCFFTPCTQIPPGHAELGLCSLLGLAASPQSSFLWQSLFPSLRVSIFPSPPLPFSPLPEQGFPTKELLPWLDSEPWEGRIFKAEIAIHTR